jgi:hypothetical protein
LRALARTCAQRRGLGRRRKHVGDGAKGDVVRRLNLFYQFRNASIGFS